MRAYLVLLFIALFSVPGNAFYIQLHGAVTDHFSGDPMKGVQIRVVKDGIDRETFITERNGKYDLVLERGYDYLVWFSGQGRVTKHVRIDTREVPIIPDVPYYDMYLQITLFLWIDGMDFSLLDVPVAEANYRHSIRNLTWDTEYTEKAAKNMSRLLAQYEREFGALPSRKRASNAESDKDKRRRERIDF